jgi:hypothetical protein
MRYLMLLYGDEKAVGSISDADRRAIVDEHIAFGARLREKGAHAGGDALTSSAEAKVLRGEGDGHSVVTDGPFAETKEQLGGFYVIECGGIDEALTWAEQVPRSPGLVVEIRPIAPV